MSNTSKEIGSTIHAYELIKSNITDQKGNMKQNIKNAKQYGFVHPQAIIPESISIFVDQVKTRYRAKESNPDFNQIYIVYGSFLYIFNWNKSKLITMFNLLTHCEEDIKNLSIKYKNKARRKKKKDSYLLPLNAANKKKRKAKKK